MVVLSLFDGMSCGQLALKKAGLEVTKYYASEIDVHAIKVAKNNFPDTVHLGSVTGVKAEDLEKIDLIIGGSPCQGFSFAGERLNFEDPRSKLFFEFIRIKEECEKVNPDLKFLLENVRMRNDHEDIISRMLKVKPIKLNSSLVSAQSRLRFYWTNIKVNSLPKNKGIFLKDIMLKEHEVDPKYIMNEKQIVQHIEHKKRHSEKGHGFGYTIADPNGKSVTLVASDYKYSGGKTVVKLSGEVTPLVLGDRCRKFTPVEFERLQTVPDNYTSSASDTQRYKMIGNGWNIDTIVHIFQFLKK